ncbi:phosphopantetheine-binding protein [Cellvibrio japonicus]|uniref:Acyl carrier protein n=1 Tax=Cellvibrio japonicus (strain Ueda107) TaxID=498211 RepID=B3PFI5_CELJU|nr:phosphopantetheine-binding protein [Cellvibrio japonicus]ACE84181.1 acyl carrier protein [Cellvibrio japonicus Ueda107]QEI10853.1 acyl carrier protein [Cellvibrio japonicus]QEI14429.1 acyl carrier protein [Cellvibrio japonicus]QEI18007.1 acyl carrier protein [Cellvibrio japonicus]
MSLQTPQEQELATLLVSALDLEDLEPGDINPEAPLFDASHSDSLGLDSIDALEISLAVAKHYKVQLKADDENNKAIFYSLRSLSHYINEQRA